MFQVKIIKTVNYFQSDTFSNFETMTDRLVDEILKYLAGNQTVLPTRISFVGHSLGTILIRSAIQRPKIAHLIPRFYTFLSLSGPHLGTLYNNSGLVNMGKYNPFLHQLLGVTRTTPDTIFHSNGTDQTYFFLPRYVDNAKVEEIGFFASISNERRFRYKKYIYVQIGRRIQFAYVSARLISRIYTGPICSLAFC